MHDDEFNGAMIFGPIVATLIGFAGMMNDAMLAMIGIFKSIDHVVSSAMNAASIAGIASR